MIELNKIYQGDCLEVLKTFPDESINCVMTSPPYWALRDYGTANWEGGNIECDHQVGRNTRTFTDKSKIQSGNFGGFGDESIKNGELCPKCGAKRIDKQLGLEPTFQEYIKKLCDIFDEVKRVLRKDGTCWVNMGDTYNAHSTGNGNIGGIEKKNKLIQDIQAGNNRKIELPDKSLCNIPARFSIEMQNRGWILRNVIIWHKPNCMPCSVKDRFTVDFEYLYFFVKNKKYWFETQLEPIKSIYDKRVDKGREEHIGKSATKNYGCNATTINSKGRNKRAVWTITTKPFKEAHFATYPEELCYTPIKAGCPEFVCNKCGKIKEIKEIKEIIHNRINNRSDAKVRLDNFERIPNDWKPRKSMGVKEISCYCNSGFSGGIVLDPFFGAGTTGLVALKQNKQFIGIELNEKYIQIAEARIKPYLEQSKLKKLEEEK